MLRADQIKSFVAKQLLDSLDFPSASSCDGCVEKIYRNYLQILATIDEKPEASDGSLWYIRRLKSAGFWGSRGAKTAFLARGVEDGANMDSLAAVYATVAQEAGYLTFERTLQTSEFDELSQWCDQELQHGTWHISEVVARLGVPSFATTGSYSKAFLYSTGQEKQWIGLSFPNQWEEDPEAGYPKPVWGEDPIVYNSFAPGRKPCASRFLWTEYARKEKGLSGIQR